MKTSSTGYIGSLCVSCLMEPYWIAFHPPRRKMACSIHFVKLASISWSHTLSSRTDPGWLRGAINNLCLRYVSVISQLQAVVTCYNILREAVVLSGTFRHIYILPRKLPVFHGVSLCFMVVLGLSGSKRFSVLYISTTHIWNIQSVLG